MSTVVLDASVAAKWFLPPAGEDLVPQALRLYRSYVSGRIEFIVPDIFWAELGNVAWKAVRRERWSAAAADRAIRSATELRFQTFESKGLLEAAFVIAADRGTSLYDSLYVALAAGSEGELVTADERLANALAARFPVKWLGFFSAS